MQRRENEGVPHGMPFTYSGYTPTMSNAYPYWVGGTSPYTQPNGQMAPKNTKPFDRTHGNLEELSQAFGGLGVYPTPAVNKGPTPGVSPLIPYSPLVNAPQNVWAAPDTRYFVPANNVSGMQRQTQHGPYYQQGSGLHPAQAVWAPHQPTNEVPELSRRRNSVSSNEEPGPQTPFFGATQNPAAFHQKMVVPDNSPQTWGSPSPQQQLAQPVGSSSGSPQQLWREANGYVVADFDAKCMQTPSIPRPIPAIFSGDKSRGTLETSLENKTHTTNVYIRGLHPNTTDEMLEAYGARFGGIASAKSMIDQHTGMCKGFGFIKYHNYKDGENCIRGFYHWGYESKWARDSHNDKLKKLGDEENTNLYISNIPIELDFNEHSLMGIFTDYECLSAKILRDQNGLSRGVGFARFATPEICRAIIIQYNGRPIGVEGQPISIRFADTPDQKRLKLITQERRAYKTQEYNTAAFGPGSPYQQYATFVQPAASPLPARATLVTEAWGNQSPYNYAFSGLPVGSPIPMMAHAKPVVKITGVENAPLPGKTFMKTEATGPLIDTTPVNQSNIQGTVDPNMGSALSKRNPNLPLSAKTKTEVVDKSNPCAHENENRSTTGSNNSSPTKGTPSKNPKSSCGQKSHA